MPPGVAFAARRHDASDAEKKKKTYAAPSSCCKQLDGQHMHCTAGCGVAVLHVAPTQKWRMEQAGRKHHWAGLCTGNFASAP
jgi:hypothetical protein